MRVAVICIWAEEAIKRLNWRGRTVILKVESRHWVKRSWHEGVPTPFFLYIKVITVFPDPQGRVIRKNHTKEPVSQESANLGHTQQNTNCNICTNNLHKQCFILAHQSTNIFQQWHTSNNWTSPKRACIHQYISRCRKFIKFCLVYSHITGQAENNNTAFIQACLHAREGEGRYRNHKSNVWNNNNNNTYWLEYSKQCTVGRQK